MGVAIVAFVFGLLAGWQGKGGDICQCGTETQSGRRILHPKSAGHQASRSNDVTNDLIG
jgi:hypothetical protein